MIKLGIIGISEGNGHPYSWSAICNGYDKHHMSSCEYPSIFNYLEQKNYPTDFIKNTKVSKIWCEDIRDAKKISLCSKIPHICNDIEELKNDIDGILIARDDYENHEKFLSIMKNWDIPIFLDKPFSNSYKKALDIFNTYRSSKIFSCSGLRFSKDMKLSGEDCLKMGPIKMIVAQTPKSWSKYAIHCAETIVENIGTNFEVLESHSMELNGNTSSIKLLSNGMIVAINSIHSNIPIQVKYIGENSFVEKTFNDSFDSFKESLEFFIRNYILKKGGGDISRITAPIKLIDIST